MPYYVPGTKIYYNYTNTYGDSNYVIGINAKTENLEACLNFIDMLADPDAYLWIRSGPAGEIWDVDENGVANITDTGIESAKKNGPGSVFTMSTGEEISLWNTQWIVSEGGAMTSYTDKEGNPRTNMTTSWTEMVDISSDNDAYRAWQEDTGHDSWMDWLNANNAYCSSSALGNLSPFESIPDDTMQLTIDSIKDVVTTASWKMVYAESDADFDALWNQMVSDCEGLGAEDVISWRLADIENAKTIRDSLAAD